MVKGVSKQVIVVQSPDPKLFEQAIFILKEDAVRSGGVSEEALLREAKALLRPENRAPFVWWRPGIFWGFAGAVFMGALWLLSLFV